MPTIHFFKTAVDSATWWRMLAGNDNNLDNTHLMRFAGHFSRRVRAYTKKRVIFLWSFATMMFEKTHSLRNTFRSARTTPGLFCIFVNRAPASILEAHCFGNNGLDIRRKNTYINYYAFHIIDKEWGHIIIRFCPHPPFNAMIILNGHEYVERSARKRDIEFIKEDNCFVSIPNAPALNRIADSMISNNRDVGRLISVCERWIYSTCLCFALEQADQERTSFKYSLSVYQMEFSKNLIFKRGADVDSVFNGVIDRTRSVLIIRTIKTIFGIS